MNVWKHNPFFLLILCIATSLPEILSATPYVPPEKITTHYGVTSYAAPQIDAMYNHAFEFAQIAGFEQPLQCEVAGINFGGQREEETGWMYNVIETDNTLEVIWVWSRYFELTGDDQYNDEITDAWTYAYNFPAWLEGAGYYSSHNCAWALAAELKYRTVFNDSSHWNYALNSANYILSTPLSFLDPLNVMVTGWCCGNLYLYGEATGNAEYMDTAVSRAQEIMTWVEQDPTTRLALESWAMSSGTFVWGLCNSIFRQDPALGQSWLAIYGPMVQVYEPATYSWSNAWNVAYCNAQGGMFEVTEDSTYLDNHLWLTNYLLHKDTDNDGGIPASASGSSETDASWTTAYLAMMGCNPYLVSDIDAGVLIIRSPENRTHITLGEPIDVLAVVGNWGTIALTNVMVVASGPFQDTMYVDLPLNGNLNVNFGPWIPSSPGIDSLRVTVSIPGDGNAFNDSDVNLFMVQAPLSGGYTQARGLHIDVRAKFANGRAEVSFKLPQDDDITLTLYNSLGRRVTLLLDGHYTAGFHNAPLSFSDLNLSSGTYIVRLQGHTGTACTRLYLVK